MAVGHSTPALLNAGACSPLPVCPLFFTSVGVPVHCLVDGGRLESHGLSLSFHTVDHSWESRAMLERAEDHGESRIPSYRIVLGRTSLPSSRDRSAQIFEHKIWLLSCLKIDSPSKSRIKLNLELCHLLSYCAELVLQLHDGLLDPAVRCC